MFLAIPLSDSIFSENEIKYLKSQPVARVATFSISKEDLNISLQPDVESVGFEYEEGTLYIGGTSVPRTTKYEKILKNKKVAVVVDDLETIDPWKPRGIRIYGDADLVNRQGRFLGYGSQSEHRWIRIRPNKKWSWGIDEPLFKNGKFNVKRAQI
jgi:pyridoxamine 5'-phosphate oxidase family protein